MKAKLRKALLLTLSILSVLALAAAIGAFAWFHANDYSLSPGGAMLVYDDIDRFAALGAPAVPSEAELAEYLEAGSAGLDAYAEMYRVSPSSLRRAVEDHPEAYAAPAELAAAIRETEPQLRAAMTRLEELYSSAIFPPTYYLVGDYGAGGANGSVGVLIAAETYHARPEELPCLVMHEIVHFNHAAATPMSYFSDWTNLARAIKEGAADFVAEKTAGCHTNEENHAWGREHEAELWARFSETLSSHDTGEWFWAEPSDPDQPRDLGYFLGYRIVESFYKRQADGRSAIERIMTISDFEALLVESGYAPSKPTAD